MGGVTFPPIGELPYLLTPAPDMASTGFSSLLRGRNMTDEPFCVPRTSFFLMVPPRWKPTEYKGKRNKVLFAEALAGGFGGDASPGDDCKGQDARPMAIEDALAAWLGNQRWFAGKGQELARSSRSSRDTELVAGDPELRPPDRRGLAPAPPSTTTRCPSACGGGSRPGLKHARIGPSGDGRQAYDALHGRRPDQGRC